MDMLGAIAICLANLLYLLEVNSSKRIDGHLPATVDETTEPGNCLYLNKVKQINFTRLVYGLKRGQQISIKGSFNTEANNFIVATKGDYSVHPRTTFYFSGFSEYIKKSRNDHCDRYGSSNSSKTDNAINLQITRLSDDSIEIMLGGSTLHLIPSLHIPFYDYMTFIRFSGDIEVNTICSVETYRNIRQKLITTYNLLDEPPCLLLPVQTTNSHEHFASLHMGLNEGNMLLIEGIVNHTANYLHFTLLNNKWSPVFSINASLEEKKISVAMYYEGIWTNKTSKETQNKFFKPDELFKINIIRQDGGFSVFVNNLNLLELPIEYDVNILKIQYFKASYQVAINTVCIKKLGDEIQQSTIYPSVMPREQLSTEPRHCSNDDKLRSPEKNMTTKLAYGFEKGKMLTITGNWEYRAEHVEFFILNSTGYFAFGLNVTANKYRAIINLTIVTSSDFSQLVKSQLAMNDNPTDFKIDIIRQAEHTFVVHSIGGREIFAEILTKSYVNLTETAYFGFIGKVTITSVCYSDVPKKEHRIPGFDMLQKNCANNLANENLSAITTRFPRTFDNNTSLRIYATSVKDNSFVRLINETDELLTLNFDLNLNMTVVTTNGDFESYEPLWITANKKFELRIRGRNYGYEIFIDGKSVLNVTTKVYHSQLISIDNATSIFGVCMGEPTRYWL